MKTFETREAAQGLCLSPWAFRLWWIGVVATHVLLGVLYHSLFVLHRYLYKIQLGEVVEEFVYQVISLKLFPSEFQHFYFPVMNASAIVALCHGLEVTRACGYSLYHRQLCFQSPGGSASSVFAFIQATGLWSGGVSSYARFFRRGYEFLCWLLSPLTRCFRCMGAFYTLHSLTFVLMMEGIEVICQTAQAYRMSYNVSVPWINRLFAFLTAVNCWSSPLIFTLFHRHPVSERAFAMVVDAVLNGIQNGVIPWMFLYPYFRDTARVAMPIEGTRFGSDLFSAQLDANIRQLFPSSWSTFFAIVAPGFLMLGYMTAIKSSIVRAGHSVHPRPADPGTTLKSVSPTPVTEGPLPPTDCGPQSNSSQTGRRIDKAIHTLLFLWGFVVLACHFYAVHIGNQAKVAGCVLVLQPWMTSQYLCSLVNVSCAENHIVGHREELQSILIRMVPTEIQEFIITDCPELEVPPRIQSFLNIQLFAITNSTIAAWDMDAALKENAHPYLLSVSIVNSNLSAVPPGLLHTTPPPILGYIAFTRTNLTTLPDNVNEYWTIPYTIALEGSPGVTEVPIALGQMPWVSEIFLDDNAIAFIPDDFFEATTFSKLDLSGNPLVALPANLGGNDAINRLLIKDTKVDLLPCDWFELYAETVGWTITATGTPLCDHLAAGEPVITANDSEVSRRMALPGIWRVGSNIRVSCSDQVINCKNC